MDYQVIVNGTNIISGGWISLTLTCLGLILLIGLIISYVWRLVRETDVLKYEFITIIAHKFRTPLTSIKWLVDESLVNEQDGRRRELFSDIKESNDKLIDLTSTLVELTDTDNESRGSYDLKPYSLSDLVRSVCASYKKRFQEKNIAFFVQIPDEPIMGKFDWPRLEFVIQTLLENALAYTPIGRQVEINVWKKFSKVYVSITDKGIGIDRADLPKIFGKFYRAPNAQSADTEGFGVGLFLAKSVIKRHHGKIEVASPGIGEGSTFTVTLPAAKRKFFS